MHQEAKKRIGGGDGDSEFNKGENKITRQRIDDDDDDEDGRFSGVDDDGNGDKAPSLPYLFSQVFGGLSSLLPL